MIWKTRSGNYLIEGQHFPIRLSGTGYGIELPDGNTIHTSAEYFEVSDCGRVIRKYPPPSSSTLEHDLFVRDIHKVSGSKLIRYFVTENDGSISVKQVQLLWGLVPASSDEIHFDPAAFTGEVIQ
jgi:hypothetical protein